MTTSNPIIELRTSRETDRIALRGVRLRARLAGLSLQATLEQTFVNLEPVAIEAIYTFPLPDTAAVCGFEVVTGDHVLTGKVEAADDAIQQYDEAIGNGDGAFLLEQDRPDVFTARIGNLKPGQAATIRISYIAPLERVDRSIRLRFPTTIAPRYISAAGVADPLQAAIDGDALNPPHLLHVPYGIEMHVDVRLGPDVRKITSPTHAVRAAGPATNDGSWSVELSGGLAEMDRDIVLELDLAGDPQPRVDVARGPDDAHYLAVTFAPEFDEQTLGEYRPSETIFVLDCSGSMQGNSIQQATAALELCLRSLSSGDRFNVCRFGSTFQMLAPTSAAYSAGTMERALAFIRQGADLGGTEIYEPLKTIFSVKPTAGELRNVVLLTDGQVSNEPLVIELARKARSTNRLFTFGIGSSASAHLVRSLARVTGGAAEFISGSERIEDKVLRTFSRIGSPMVTELAVRWGDAEVQSPPEIPPLFDGDLLRVFARATGRLPETVTLECRTSAGPRSWSLPVGQPTMDDGLIATSWARTMIEALEEADGQQTDRPAKRQASSERRIVTLSKQFGVLCSQTAFVAVEHRSVEDRNAGMPELRRVPVQLAAGWGGVLMDVDSLQAGGAMFAFAAPPVGGSSPKFRKGAASTSDVRRVMSKCGVAAPAAPPDDPLLRLLSLQSAEGWFGELSAAHGIRELLQSGGYDLGDWDARIATLCATWLPAGDTVLAQRLVATVVAVAVLRRAFADRRDLWRRAEAKAHRWLQQAMSLDYEAVDRLLDEAGKLSISASN